MYPPKIINFVATHCFHASSYKMHVSHCTGTMCFKTLPLFSTLSLVKDIEWLETKTSIYIFGTVYENNMHYAYTSGHMTLATSAFLERWCVTLLCVSQSRTGKFSTSSMKCKYYGLLSMAAGVQYQVYEVWLPRQATVYSMD